MHICPLLLSKITKHPLSIVPIVVTFEHGLADSFARDRLSIKYMVKQQGLKGNRLMCNTPPDYCILIQYNKTKLIIVLIKYTMATYINRSHNGI